MSRFVVFENYHWATADLRVSLLIIFIEGSYSGGVYLPVLIKIDLV